ncbi:MAG: hypothetical protein ACFB4I_04805 [Cyanophyceae cyanobacterium]
MSREGDIGGSVFAPRRSPPLVKSGLPNSIKSVLDNELSAIN